jgi:hypothetical protein
MSRSYEAQMGKMRNAYIILGEPEGKKPLGDIGIDERIILNDINKIGLRYNPVAGCCNSVIESLGSIKCREFLDQLSGCHLLHGVTLIILSERGNTVLDANNGKLINFINIPYLQQITFLKWGQRRVCQYFFFESSFICMSLLHKVLF